MGAVLSDITQGRRVGSVRAGGVVVHEVAYGAGAWMAAHAHARANITLVIGGGFGERTEEGEYGARALGVVFKRAGVQHETGVLASGLRTVVLELEREGERRLCEALGSRRGSACFANGALTRATVRAWAASRLAPSARGHALDVAMAGVAEALRATPRACETPGRASAMRGELEQRAGEGFGTSALAARFGLHPTTVTRIFRRELGCGVMEAVRVARVRWAAERLAMTDAPLCRVASACGFADQSHMGRQFRRETGLTPGEYRSLARA